MRVAYSRFNNSCFRRFISFAGRGSAKIAEIQWTLTKVGEHLRNLTKVLGDQRTSAETDKHLWKLGKFANASRNSASIREEIRTPSKYFEKANWIFQYTEYSKYVYIVCCLLIPVVKSLTPWWAPRGDNVLMFGIKNILTYLNAQTFFISLSFQRSLHILFIRNTCF